MKMTAMFLATLVAVLLAGGCNALTGCPGSPECDPNWVPPTDGGADGNGADGSVSKGDVSSSPETAPVCRKDLPTGKWRSLNDILYIMEAKLTPDEQFPVCGVHFTGWWVPESGITWHDINHLEACGGDGECGELERVQ